MRKIIPVALSLLLFLTGCSGAKSATPATTASPTSIADTEKYAGPTISVADIKKRYGGIETDNNGIMPMYNVDDKKVFTFDFKADFGDIPVSDVITVHTDALVMPESEIYTLTGLDFGYRGEGTRIEVKPGMSVLASEKNKDQVGWGNAPIYYIRINYDMNTNTPQKLDKPIVVPFTIQSELPVPNLRYEIDGSGRLKLVWDKVAGAEKYNVYNASNLELLTTSNKPVSGADTGYKTIPLLEATVTVTEYDDFMRDGNGGILSYKGIVSSENTGINGNYYVTAVAEDKESNFSLPVATPKLSAQLPHQLKSEDNISLLTYKTIKELPKTVKVQCIDGSFVSKEIVYDANKIQIASSDTEVPYTIKGTALTGHVFVAKMAEEDKAQLLSDGEKANDTAGNVILQNDTNPVPAPDVPTIIDNSEDKSPETSTETPNNIATTEAFSDANEKDTIKDQIDNTQKQVKDGDEEQVPVVDSTNGIDIVADNAFEEYLVRQMYAAQNEISLKAFPEEQNGLSIGDEIQKVVYQNPLIIGVKSFGYDYKALTLLVEYNTSADVIAKQQKEIITEANKIVSSVIKSNMAPEEKRKAIYDYLDQNTHYDDDALKSAEANGFKKTDSKFDDSFTTYGIMVKKVGVCMSYAYTYKLLGDLADIENVVVTGTMNGVPHAWNKVKIDNEWLLIDSTNNNTNSGVPYFAYEMNDETSKKEGYVDDDKYWIDTELTMFAGKTNKYDYYVANDLEVSDITAYSAKLGESLKNGLDRFIIRSTDKLGDQELYDATGKTFAEVAKDKLDKARMYTVGTYVMITTN